MIDAEENAQADQPNLEQKVLAILQSLNVSNDAALRDCNRVAQEVQGIEAALRKAKQAAVQQLSGAFNPEVLLVLKRNADQLEELKQQHKADQERSQATAKKLMLWASVNSTEQDLQADAVKHGRFKWFQLPGSSLSSGSPAAKDAGSSSSSTVRAMKFWHTGLPAGAAVPRTFSDTPWAGDQLQPQRSITNLLFGRGRRSSAGGAAASPSPGAGSRRVSEGSASWRSSCDGNAGGRRGSHRSSDSGHARTSGTVSQPQASAEQGMLATLATGEGPLSKSHSMLAKPSVQQEAVVGRSLEIVAEDEREGHDSPQPGAGPRSSTTLHPALMATFNPAEQGHIVKLLAGPSRATSPIDTPSFSFGNKQDDEPHSPNLMLRGSVSSRPADSRGAVARDPAAAPAAGPLTRCSVQLQASMVSRTDPFDAPEPQPQPFVEQMRLEDQAMKAGQATQQAAAPGFMGVLRRSMGGALKLGVMAAAGVAAGPAALAAAAVSPSAVRKRTQSHNAPLLDPNEPGPLRASAGHMLQQPPTAEGDVTFLDLDATAAYTKGISGIIATLQHNVSSGQVLNTSESSSQPQSPTSAAAAGQQGAQGMAVSAAAIGSAEDAAAEAAAKAAAAMTAPATLARAVSPARPPIHDEIVPANEDAEQHQQVSKPSLQHGVDGAPAQHLEQQHGQRRVAPPSPTLSPEASGQMPSLPPHHVRGVQSAQPGTPFSAAGGPVQRSDSSGAGSRRQSQGLPSVGMATRGLPMMGQASMDILGRPSISSTTSSKQLVSSSSMNLRLTEVYNQTTGNPSPLAAGLASIRRVSSSSQGSRSLPPRSRTSPRALMGEASAVPAPSLGPLAKQYSSTMQSAKKSAQVAGLASVSPREGTGRKSPWGWQALGLPTGPGAPLADQTIDPATYPQGNKYAASWGLVDSAVAAAATATPGLARQNSATTGALSRQQSQAAIQGQLSRQHSTMSQRQSPRYTAEQSPGQQQQRRTSTTGAAGRYANPSSVTPTEDSPRSERGTPRTASDRGAAQPPAGGTRALKSRRISDVGSEDSAYFEVESGSRASSFSGYSSSSGQGGRAGAHGGWKQPQQQRSSAKGAKPGGAKVASPVPQPPAFLTGKPTSAQAAVAAAWSPNKHASAIAQAPAGWRSYGLSSESSGVNYGFSPHGLIDTPMQPNGSSRNGGHQQQQQHAAYAGGYKAYGGMASAPAHDIYAPQRELRVNDLSPQQRQQQTQHVVTAVDMARARSFRRTSSSGGGGYSMYTSGQQQEPGYIGGDNGSRALGTAASPGKSAFIQRQGSARQGMAAAAYNVEYD